MNVNKLNNIYKDNYIDYDTDYNIVHEIFFIKKCLLINI
jgi:hypothetical protein